MGLGEDISDYTGIQFEKQVVLSSKKQQFLKRMKVI